jgi:hypothetical protein
LGKRPQPAARRRRPRGLMLRLLVCGPVTRSSPSAVSRRSSWVRWIKTCQWLGSRGDRGFSAPQPPGHGSGKDGDAGPSPGAAEGCGSLWSPSAVRAGLRSGSSPIAPIGSRSGPVARPCRWAGHGGAKGHGATRVTWVTGRAGRTVWASRCPRRTVRPARAGRGGRCPPPGRGRCRVPRWPSTPPGVVRTPMASSSTPGR